MPPPQSGHVGPALIGDGEDEAQAARGVAGGGEGPDLCVPQAEHICVLQKVADLPLEHAGAAAGVMLGELIVGAGHADFAAGLFPEPVRPAVVVPVAVGDEDGLQVFQVQAQGIKAPDDQVTVLVQGLHAVQQDDPLGGLQQEATHVGGADEGELVKKAGGGEGVHGRAEQGPVGDGSAPGFDWPHGHHLS